MRFARLLAVLFSVATVVYAEEMHKWRGKSSTNAVEAAFDKMDGQTVCLKDKAGKVLTVKLENLCEADQLYVEDLTYTPRDVVVTFKKRRPLGLAYEEEGNSASATIRDTVRMQWTGDSDGKSEAVRESVWKIESVDIVGKPLSPQKEGATGKLDTRGKFVLVSYEVQNVLTAPVRSVPPPVLFDSNGDPYVQYSSADADLRDYVPKSVLLAGSDALNPGMPQLFWAYYEMPADAVPASIEVFPLRTGDMSERTEIKGKRLFLNSRLAKAGAEAAAPNPPPAAPEKNAPAAVAAQEPDAGAAGSSDKKVILVLNATKTKQDGDTRSDYLKTRSFTYQVDMRMLSSESKQVPVTLKVFFTGSTSDRRDLVVDRQEREITLEQNKNKSESFTSREITERRSYYYYYFDYFSNTRKRVSGAQLNGVIIQAWAGGSLVKGISKGDPSLKKYEEAKDVVKEMGEMKESETAL